MWNFKTLGLPLLLITFQNWSKILKFKSLLAHIDGVKCTWCVQKNLVYYIRKHKNVKKNSSDLKLLSF
jgi:hypothetical protein